MRTRRLTHLAAAGALAVAGWLGVAAVPAAAVSGIETGWWWRANPGGTAPTPPQAPLLVPLPTAPPAPPAPPNVGEGNLMVAATPDGATAIAAVRATGVGNTLTLTLAENGNVGGQAASLQACPISGLWAPAAGGRWDDKPSFTCSGTAVGVASADGTSWAFEVGNLVTDDDLDVAIVPMAADGTTGATAPFQLVFKAPAADAFGTAGGGDTATTEFDSTFDYAAPTSDFTAPTADFAAEFATTDTFDTGATFGLAGGAPLSPPAAPTRVPARAAPLRQTPAGAVASVVPASDDAKVFALLVVLLAAGAGYWVTRQQVPALQGLGRVSVRSVAPRAVEPVEAGLGRFRKPRTGPPPSLF